jgi:hypothetical protein
MAGGAVEGNHGDNVLVIHRAYQVWTSINIPWIFRLPEGTSLDQALQIVTAAEQQSGANRSKLRDVLSSGSQIAGVRFQSTGEPR